jgi:ribonuclease HI
LGRGWYIEKLMSTYQIFSDGAARGNPGPAGIGVVIKNEQGEIVEELYEYLGETTNNQAEYKALLLGLKKAAHLKAKNLNVFLDSELVVKQLNGDYAIKNEGLIPLYEKVIETLKKFPSVKISHIRREKNKEADKLANKAIDHHFRKK